MGGPKGIRTPDLFYAIEALYQLSYEPLDVFPILLMQKLWMDVSKRIHEDAIDLDLEVKMRAS
jgi:hypothetical protein